MVMENGHHVFRNSRRAYGLGLAGLAALLAVGAVAITLGTFLGWIVGGLLIAISALRIGPGWRGFFDRTPKIEIYDHCVIDTRLLDDWVLWQDVQEIVVTNIGVIGLRVADEEPYVRDHPYSICRFAAEHMGMFDGLPRLLLSSTLLECSFRELLGAVRSASQPYGIPIRMEHEKHPLAQPAPTAQT